MENIIGFEEWAMDEDYIILSHEINGVRYFIGADSDIKVARRIAKKHDGEIFDVLDVIIGG